MIEKIGILIIIFAMLLTIIIAIITGIIIVKTLKFFNKED